jgi:phosphoribosylformylglycinamidine synthase
MASGIGAEADLPYPTDPIPVWFGEDQGRYLVTVPSDDKALLRDITDEARELGFAAPIIGRTGGDTLKLAGARAIPVADLKSAHESWFPRFMEGELV